MKSHALVEPIRVETMGQLDSRKSPISRGFPEIVDTFPRTNRLEADEANFDIFRLKRLDLFPRTSGGYEIKMDVSSHIECVMLLSHK